MQYKLNGSNLIIEVGSELDHHHADVLYKNIINIEKNKRYKNLIFDFSNTAFMDSSGVGLIISQYKHLSMSEGNVIVVGLSDNLEKLFYVSGLHKIIRTYSKLEDVFNEK